MGDNYNLSVTKLETRFYRGSPGAMSHLPAKKCKGNKIQPRSRPGEGLNRISIKLKQFDIVSQLYLHKAKQGTIMKAKNTFSKLFITFGRTKLYSPYLDSRGTSEKL